MPRAKRAAAPVPDTRSEIFAAALAILQTEGHGALTVRHVAARAGCSTIGVYTWFGGKDGLVDAILLDGFQRFAQALARSRPVNSPLGALLGQARAYRRWALANRTSYEVMFMGAVPGHVANNEAQIAGLAAYELLRNEVIAAGDRGLINEPDADVVAMAMWGLVHGMVSLEIASAEPAGLGARGSFHQRSFDVAVSSLEQGLLSGTSGRRSDD